MKYVHSKEVSNKKYRYELSRVWDPSKKPIVVVMCNPSIEEDYIEDTNIRKLSVILDTNGYGEMVVIYLFAYRSFLPQGLIDIPMEEAIGSQNNNFTTSILRNELDVLIAWGKYGEEFQERKNFILDQIKGLKVFCLGFDEEGNPYHPCNVAYGSSLVPYKDKRKNNLRNKTYETRIKI